MRLSDGTLTVPGRAITGDGRQAPRMRTVYLNAPSSEVLA
jgi:hypothetical protein